MSLYTDATKEIIESILSGVKDGIEELSNGDKTFKARIVELTSPARCKVLHNGVNYTVISNVYCEVGDLVRVCAPCNNWNELYVEANLTPGKTLRDIAKLETRVNELKNTIAELNTNLKYAIDESDRIYQGVDLTVKFTEEIAGYANPWRWIKARLAARNVDGLHIGDYIPIYMGNYLIKMQIAGINTYYRTTDREDLKWHIDWISKDCYPEPVRWFTSNNNNGTSTDPAPYIKSTVKAFLDGLVAKLPAEVQEVISSKRFLLESRYSASGTLTDSTAYVWRDLGKLWIPSEYEVFGSCIWSTAPWGSGQAVQYPIFANNWFNRIKGNGDGGDRAYWWILSVCGGNSTKACLIDSGGSSYDDNCSAAHLVPVCFRIKEESTNEVKE